MKKKFSKIIGISKEEFDTHVNEGQIKVRSARLIPTIKTGDEGALTSIFLSSLRLVKEFRDQVFKDLKLSRNGKIYYYTEFSVADKDQKENRIDGLILVVIKGIIKDAAFFEMKNENNIIKQDQIENYIKIARDVQVNKLVTVSNEFVADHTQSPLSIKPPTKFELYHFSWTYLITKGQLLLFDNDQNIEDDDQVEIMREVLAYMDSSVSGVSGYNQMKPEWKELCDGIYQSKVLNPTKDEFVPQAVLSWHQEEKDIALLLSKKLGVMVRSSAKKKDSIKLDSQKVCKEHLLTGALQIKNAVSDFKIKLDFERRSVTMAIKISSIPPNKGTTARINWIHKQLENCRKKNSELFNSLENKIFIDTDVKFARQNLKVKFTDVESLFEETKGKEIQAFHILLADSFGNKFSSRKGFIKLIEEMVLDFYEGIVQHISTWTPPAPRVNQKE